MTWFFLSLSERLEKTPAAQIIGNHFLPPILLDANAPSGFHEEPKGQAMNKTIMGILGLITLTIGVVLLLSPQRFAAAFFLALVLCAIGGTLLLLAVGGLTPRGRSVLLWTSGGFVGAVILFMAVAANLPPPQPGRPATPPSGAAVMFYTVLPLLPVPVSVLALILSLAGWLPGTRRADGQDGVQR